MRWAWRTSTSLKSCTTQAWCAALSSSRPWATSRKACWCSCRCTWTCCPALRSAADLHDALAAHYARTNTPAQWVKVLPPTDDLKLAADTLANTNQLELRVFANEEHRQAVLIARLDNLGKGASGAAVQNLQLMLGL